MHTVTSADTVHLVQFLGVFSLLFGLVTLCDLQNFFVATIPLVMAGGSLIVVPYTQRFQKLVEIDELAVRPKKTRSNEGGANRQSSRRKAREERKRWKKGKFFDRIN
ncbi:Hypothetical predicted protein [Lecanosticta acicola]|uniref:Uncharacterized protein n=1 Tax=Lecanosticta acicola TaxID=111012 RepID=A0AAI9ED99_9PEZI|nr:Hypothetical predicted protein [Lecanosticta acicola]